MKRGVHFQFCLYVAGDGPNSVQAVANLTALCDGHLPGRHTVEVVDILKQQRRALEDGVMLTPLLVKLAPAPVRKIIGTLTLRDPLLQALGLPLTP